MTHPRKIKDKFSRSERRMMRRLGSAMEAYSIGCKVSRMGGKEYTKPGAKKYY